MKQERRFGTAAKKRQPRPSQKQQKQQIAKGKRDIAELSTETDISSWVDDPCDEWEVGAVLAAVGAKIIIAVGKWFGGPTAKPSSETRLPVRHPENTVPQHKRSARR